MFEPLNPSTLYTNDYFERHIECSSNPLSKRINFETEHLSDEALTYLFDFLKNNLFIKEVHVNKSLLGPEQQKRFVELTGINELKGIKITTSEGVMIGPVHTNWENYANEKRKAHLEGMRETTRRALDSFKEENGRPPKFVVDFGAGTGMDTINVAKECQKIWAVDGDQESLVILQEELEELKKGMEPIIAEVHCINAPFIQLDVPEPVELLISSYTWPYRRPIDFSTCWKKCVDIVSPGGYIAGQFFGPRKDTEPDPGMTYHTEEEILALLEPDFEITWFLKEPEGSDFKIYGGDTPAWGDLFHVVAKRVFTN